MVLVQPHIKLNICFNYTHLSTLMDKDTPPCYTQSFYISLRLNRPVPPLPPPHERIHPSSFKSVRQDF